jgi:crotonobetainyl-CoA:carnitine CoA-transferase CaiB-like acyl-CoA transferase
VDDRVAELPAGLLGGVRVLDLSIWRPGPYATQLLVEMGAEVVKVEPPGGDPMRVFPALFAILNAGKRSAAVDLKDRAGRAAVLERARAADAVVEGFRPGVVRKLGVDHEAVARVNPSVVYCSISGYGQDGPLAQLPGHDLNYQAWAGAVEPRPGDDEPSVARLPIADLVGGAYAAMAVSAALVRRASTGEGERIDVSMADVLATWTGAASPLTLPDGQAVGGGVPGYGTFRAADGGWVALGIISEDHFWDALTRALGLDDIAGLSFPDRLERKESLTVAITDAIATRGRDELVTALVAAGVPVSAVLSQAEMLAAEHFRATSTVFEDADGSVTMGHPLRYERQPAVAPGDVPPLQEGVEHLPLWSTAS